MSAASVVIADRRSVSAKASHPDRAPERRAASRVGIFATLRRRPLLLTVVLAFLGSLALQLWRPCFFLTDDTLTGWLPVATEACRRLWEGRSPFFNDYLFGGTSWVQDPGIFSLCSPWVLLFSFLAKTPWYWLLADVVSTLDMVAIAAAFCWSGQRLRRHFELPISDLGLVALSLSYAFTPFNFIVGASWIGFLNAPAAFPLIFAAVFERDFRRALVMQAGALVYALFGGHAHPFVALVAFGSLLCVLMSVAQRSWRPVLLWAAAGAVALIIALPLLWPALQGFAHTDRNQGLSVGSASFSNLPPWSLLLSFLLGPLSTPVLSGIKIDLSDPLYNLAIAFSLVNLPLLGVLATKRRWNAVEVCLGVAAVLTACCIIRPGWLGEAFTHLPLLKSLRWPFREIAVLHFFTHILFLLAFCGFARKALGAATVGAGVLAYALVLLNTAPTFYLFELDRRLIISGEADRFWNDVKRQRGIQPGALQFVVEAPPRFVLLARPSVPFSLLAGYNFASLFRVANVSGYSPTPPPSARWLEDEIGVRPWFWGGIFHREYADAIVTARPATQKIVLTGMFPARIELFRGAERLRYELDAQSGRAHALPD